MLDDFLSPDGYIKYNVLIPGDIENYINICLNGNGNFQQNINLTEFLSVFLIMAETYKTLSNCNLSSDLANFTIITNSILSLQHPIYYINAISSNIRIDYLPSINLLELNKYTNAYSNSSYQIYCSNQAYNQWVFSSTDCSEEYLYISNKDPKKLLGSKLCLVI